MRGFTPSTVTKLGQKPLMHDSSALHALWSTLRFRPRSVCFGRRAVQFDCSPQSPQPSHTASLMNTRRAAGGNSPFLRRRRFSAAHTWS
ncbi:hypothetical protein D9M69_599190 [compost metagenome]